MYSIPYGDFLRKIIYLSIDCHGLFNELNRGFLFGSNESEVLPFKTMSTHYVGQRLSFEGCRCTVRYIGPVADNNGDWLGVEWDDPHSRGKHDGTHRGKVYFKCKYSR